MRTRSFFSVPLLLAAAALLLSACAGASGLRKATGGLYSGQFAGGSRPQIPPQYAAFAAELESRIAALEQESQALMRRTDGHSEAAAGALNRLQNSRGIVMTHMQLGSAANNPALAGLLQSMQDELTQLEVLEASLTRQSGEAQRLSEKLTELASTSYSAAQLPAGGRAQPAATQALRDLRVRALIGAVPLNVLQQELDQQREMLTPVIASARAQLPQLAQSVARSARAHQQARANQQARASQPAQASRGGPIGAGGLTGGLAVTPPNLLLPPSLALPRPSDVARMKPHAQLRKRTASAPRPVHAFAPIIVARPRIESLPSSASAPAVGAAAVGRPAAGRLAVGRPEAGAPAVGAAAPPRPVAARTPAMGAAAARTPAARTMSAERAFVVIRFRGPHTRYETALARAIAEAQRRCPTSLYTIAALAPQAEQQPLAESHAQQVSATLRQLQVPQNRVTIMPTRIAAVENNEVHIYLH